MGLVELWVLLKNWYNKYRYNGRWLTEIQRQFPHVTPNVNKAEIKTELW